MREGERDGGRVRVRLTTGLESFEVRAQNKFCYTSGFFDTYGAVVAD